MLNGGSFYTVFQTVWQVHLFKLPTVYNVCIKETLISDPLRGDEWVFVFIS